MAWKRRRSWTADALCRLDSDCAPVDDSEQDLAPPDALFPPRFLVQETIFAHSPYEGVYPNQPRLQGRADWHCLRGIAPTECAILPVRELAVCPGAARANVPAQGSAPRRVGPAGAQCLTTDTVGSQIKCLCCGSSGTAQGKRTVSTTRSQISGSGIWMWLEVIARVSPDRCFSRRYHSGRGSFSESSSSPTPHPILAHSPLAEVPSPNPIGSASGESRTPSVTSWFRPLSTTDRGALSKGPLLCLTKSQASSSFTSLSTADSGTSGNESPQHQNSARSVSVQESATAVLLCRRQPNPRSGAKPACTEPAHSGRSLGAQHGRTRHHPRGPCRVSRSQRDNALSLALAGSSRIPAVANAAGKAAPRNWTAAAATVMDIELNGASVSHNDRPSASYQFTATTSLFHITFLTILLSNSSTAPSLSTPSDLLLPQPCGLTAPALMTGHCRCASTLSRGFELKYNEKKSSSGTGSSQREEACSMPAESAGSDDMQSVLP